MTSRHPALAAALLAALLASCSPTPSDTTLLEAAPPGEAPTTHAVRFPSSTDQISPAEGAGLAEFLRRSGAHRGDRVAVAGGDGDLGEARRARVTETLRRMGLAAQIDAKTITAGRDSVLVMLEPANVLAAGDCPQWQPMGGFDPTNKPSRNFGCSTSATLYLMVADPSDLVTGREPGPADAEPGMRAVQRYLEGTKPGSAGAGGGGGAGGAGASPAPAATANPMSGGSSGQP